MSALLFLLFLLTPEPQISPSSWQRKAAISLQLGSPKAIKKNSNHLYIHQGRQASSGSSSDMFPIKIQLLLEIIPALETANWLQRHVRAFPGEVQALA